MDKKHREIIINNIDSLIAQTKYKDLMEACVKNGLLSNIMKKSIEEENDEISKHKKLLEKITRRGPTAYNRLFEILQQLNYTNAAKILRPGEYSGTTTSIKQKKLEKQASRNGAMNIEKNETNINPDGCTNSQMDVDEKDSSELKPYSKEISSVNQKPVEKCTTVPQHIVNCSIAKIPIYQMVKKDRGVFFCVNIINFKIKDFVDKRRLGAEIDGQSLLHIFKELGYTLFYYEDLTASEFESKLSALLSSKYLKNTESFVMALMSHGEMVDTITDRVEFSDGAVLSVNKILDNFQNNNCPSLVRKPKVFIFPFCRGSISDRGTNVQTDSISYNKSSATFSDILICYATVPGYRSHREPDSGSWYVQKLCQVFASHAFDTHLEDLLKLVGDAAAQIRTEDGKMQTASYSSYGFHKKLYFNPGYYE